MFVTGKPFQPSHMFESKSGAYPCEAPLWAKLDRFVLERKRLTASFQAPLDLIFSYNFSCRLPFVQVSHY
jgi:hypothetical protein